MRPSIRPLSFAFLLVAFVLSSQKPDLLVADLLFLHGRIYTCNPAQKWAHALAVRGQKILAVGSDRALEKYRGPKTMVIDLHGRMAMPGIIDSHTHFLFGSRALAGANLEGAPSVEGVRERIRSYAQAHPELAWVRGGGWIYGFFPPTGLPTKELLDDAVPDRPAAILSYDMHSLWVNSRALALAGIIAKTPDPTENGITIGIIVRDPNTGEPTGVLKEAAMTLIRRVMPEPPLEEDLRALRAGMAEANRNGLTAIVNASGDVRELELYDELHRRGELTLHTTTAFGAPVGVRHRLTPDELDTLERARRRFHDDWVRTGVVKFFADGVVETHTAAMVEPYADDPRVRGSTNYTLEEFRWMFTELDRRGFQIMTHAIGDGAVRMTLDAYEVAEKQNGPRDRRFRIEHIETIQPSDLPRFARLGVIASMQPYHLCLGGCPDEGGVWARNLGPERLRHAMVWHDLAAAGATLAFGSDWPVASFDPFVGIQTAVTRQNLEGGPPGGWHPEQRLTLEQALQGYTRNAAYAAFLDDRTGSLEPGKFADLIVLSQNLFDVPALEISKTKVQMTVVGGRIVYRSQ